MIIRQFSFKSGVWGEAMAKVMFSIKDFFILKDVLWHQHCTFLKIKLHCTRLWYKSAFLTKEKGFIYGIKTYRMPLTKSYVKIQNEDVEL